MQNGTDLYALDINRAAFVQACGGPCSEGCVTLARIGEDAWALGDSKRRTRSRCGSPRRSWTRPVSTRRGSA